MSDFYSACGARLRQQRDLNGWSQAELSRKMRMRGFSCPAPLVSLFENGRRRMLVHRLVQFAETLGVSPEKLLP